MNLFTPVCLFSRQWNYTTKFCVSIFKFSTRTSSQLYQMVFHLKIQELTSRGKRPRLSGSLLMDFAWHVVDTCSIHGSPEALLLQSEKRLREKLSLSPKCSTDPTGIFFDGLQGRICMWASLTGSRLPRDPFLGGGTIWCFSQ